MATFTDISTSFRNAGKQLKPRVSSVLYEESRALLSDFRDRSPVDSGFYKSNWQLLKPRFSTRKTISSFTLRNRTPYAIYMEEGAERNSAPWFYSGRGKSRSGKLTVSGGRVWAGGLNPGHAKTIHGAIKPVLTENNKRVTQLANKVADAVIGGFK